jgi:hypothetical protein
VRITWLSNPFAVINIEAERNFLRHECAVIPEKEGRADRNDLPTRIYGEDRALIKATGSLQKLVRSDSKAAGGLEGILNLRRAVIVKQVRRVLGMLSNSAWSAITWTLRLL